MCVYDVYTHIFSKLCSFTGLWDNDTLSIQSTLSIQILVSIYSLTRAPGRNGLLQGWGKGRTR